jgi:hypothetical protein
VAWERVRTNRGARTAGVDGATAYYIRARTFVTRAHRFAVRQAPGQVDGVAARHHPVGVAIDHQGWLLDA